MLIKKRYLFLIFILTVFSCQNKKNSVITTENGYELIFHELSDSKVNNKNGRIINVRISAEDNKGQIVFSSSNNGLNGVSSFYYDSVSNSPFEKILKNLYVGDSISFEMSSTIFYSSLFGEKIKLYSDSNDEKLKVYLKILNYNSSEDQLKFINKLKRNAIEDEKYSLSKEKQKWSKKFLKIFKNNGMYAIKIASLESYANLLDTIENSVGLYYSIRDLDGRDIYKTPNFKPEYYETQVDGQLLDGFKILVNNFQRGDSVLAIIPSELMFGERGSFVNQIPPFCPLMINLRIH
jgi:hypothetical protein